MIKKFQKILLVGLLLCLFLPTGLIWGQWEANGDDLDVRQLYFEIHKEHSLFGGKSSSALRDVRANYAGHMNDLVRYYQNNNRWDDADDVKQSRKSLLDYLDSRIRIADENELVQAAQIIGMIHQTVTDGAASVDPSAPPEPNPIFSDYQSIQAQQRNQNAIYILDSQVVEMLPGISAAVQSTSPTFTSLTQDCPHLRPR